MLNGSTRNCMLVSKLVGRIAKSRNGVAPGVDTVAVKAVSDKSGNVEFNNKGLRQA